MTFEEIELPSNRKFGLLFTGIFALITCYFWYKGGVNVPLGAGLASALTLTVTLVKAEFLHPLNKLWMRFGFLLGKIIGPIVLGFIFFVIITPIAIGMRLFGRDELRLKNKNRDNYWKERDPIGPEPTSFTNQF